MDEPTMPSTLSAYPSHGESYNAVNATKISFSLRKLAPRRGFEPLISTVTG